MVDGSAPVPLVWHVPLANRLPAAAAARVVNCRSVADCVAAALLRDDPPLTQAQADYTAALLATTPAAQAA